jgi:hypothetical protein
MPKPSLTDDQNKLLDAYAGFVSKHGRHPNHKSFRDLGYTREVVRQRFHSLKNLKAAAREHRSDAMSGLIDPEDFTPSRFNALRAKVKQYKRFVVTTAVTGCLVDEKFFASIKKYCEIHDACLLVLPSSDPAAADTNGFFLDPVLKDELIVYDDLALNSSLFLSSIKLSAKHIDPITGLGRIGQRNGSFVYASPKQRLKLVATANDKLPHALMTTGAVTIPQYTSEMYMSARTAYLANHDHIMGALVLEIENNRLFHYRQVQADETGAFHDLGKLYSGAGVAEDPVEALVLGDWHSGETDAVAAEAFVFAKDSIARLVRPRFLVLHDAFNGASINHHEVHDRVRRAQLANLNKLSLHDELVQLGADLDRLCDYATEAVVMVDSNHNDFLKTYLKAGKFVEDPQNAELASLLFHHMVKGAEPLRWALENIVGLKYPDRIKWLKRDEDFKIGGVELSCHGDLGSNGARGSLVQMEAAYGNSMSGHTHTPEILRNSMSVGTLSKLRLPYNRGASSWMHCSGTVTKRGQKQLVNCVEGQTRMAPKTPPKKKAA